MNNGNQTSAIRLTPEQERRWLKKRKRSESRFRLYSLSAILLACAFIVVFFVDIIAKGFRALEQAQVQVELSFNEDAIELPAYAVSEEMEDIISRARLRTIPREIGENPALLGTTSVEWVMASADVDQYLKNKPNRLKKQEVELVEKLKEEGKLKLSFNSGFFTRGDSKLPEIAGIRAAVVGSVYVLFITFIVSFPIGVMSAVYLEEFAEDNWFTRTVEVNINNLAAIPSILFGLLGLAIFIGFFHVPRSSALVGGLTLSLMTLPIIIISTRVALKAVPDSIRQGALALGASRWQTVYDQVLPQSIPGILTGTIIGIARAMGETAPLIIVGMIAYIPEPPAGVTSAATVLPAQIFTWSSASMRAFQERTAAAILVLMAVLLSLNAVAIILRNKYEHRW